jgi:hypothetical protein
MPGVRITIGRYAGRTNAGGEFHIVVTRHSQITGHACERPAARPRARLYAGTEASAEPPGARLAMSAEGGTLRL